jgi:hydroxymethylbilane synthase
MTDDSGLRIATRSSELALRQARLVADALGARGTPSTLVTFRTTGDRNTEKPLGAIGAKGLFTHELETALLKRRVDCCVHSLKDLPTEMPEGLAIAAILEREDPRDVLVVNDAIAAEGIADLPRGSRVGTSSLRRRAQLRHARPDVEVVELRGNVPTRLRKVDDGQVHAASLAAAGLHRLGVHQRIDAYLAPPDWLPAPGQGAIAVQLRAADDAVRGLIAPLDHAPTSCATRAERAFLAALEGGCQVPLGARVRSSPPSCESRERTRFSRGSGGRRRCRRRSRSRGGCAARDAIPATISLREATRAPIASATARVTPVAGECCWQ